MFTVKINTENDAFGRQTIFEVVRLLREIAKKLESGKTHGPVMDLNGNKVGTFDLNEE